MLMGMLIGSGIAVLLFATTGNALSFIAAGIGLAFGLILGAGAERVQEPS
jgi:hypothetical protein